MKRLLFLLLAATATAATLPLYIDTATNTIISPDAPTTLSGYGITDGASLPVDWSDVDGTPTTLSGYGITDAATSAQGALADSALQAADIDVTVQAFDQQLDDIAAITPTDGAILVGNGTTFVPESGDTAQVSIGIQDASFGGGMVGLGSSTTIGGAVGKEASASSGGAVGYLANATLGGAVGLNASAERGGAVGEDSFTTYGGAIGNDAVSSSGGAVGRGAISTLGGAVGNDAETTHGGAVGFLAKSTTGFAGGVSASADGDGRVQLGTGTNSTDNTIQFLSSGSVTAPQFGRIINIASSVILVDEASDLSGTLDSTKIYLIDGIIDMGSQSIEVPSGGLSIKGFSFDVSKLTSSATTYTMFTSPVGGSGNLLGMDFAMEVTGTSSQVFDVVSDTGNEAIEFVRVNWNDCTSLGTIDNYRQGLETGTGRFGGTPNLILKGVWSGGYFIDTSIVRALDAGMTGALYEAGTGFAMASRFRSNQNIDLPTSAAFLDFAPANFANPSTLQLDGCLVTRNGTKDPTDSNLTPNISASDLSSNWTDNSGLENTFVGGEAFVSSEATTTITVDGTFVDIAGTFGTSDLQHFDSPASGQLRHLGDTPIAYTVSGQMVLESGQDNLVDLKIVIFRDATTSFEDGKTTRRVIDRLQGARDVAYFVLDDDIILNQNDYVKLQVANIGATTDITAEIDSYFNVKAR